ncbi:arf-GAP domain and FG repeat-containing protein 1 isoform X1 [Anopheles bellator]|uniref:arf-GAP domain and FG repeat-containing protein 1 isoform X1 n=1 Tax=Anopheles bellator TaxID=139047 RepID=UPI00264744EB|nr:arf-GAP domain and FG repeat-containing protein 1 isoform X1 [Anopheles bellator]XP_058060964.1 arf-GAP domain and FG repeat-containing protein 1 isoform X1 [Anopheles bellator]XP_058060965.1 arf-GAP domain and FG repeat-containing protein 1 isoform X1 [Anopheles bellator]
MALVRKKLDDKILKTLRELVGVGGNKECFDCGQKGPTYINMTIGSFVCTSCSGILRGLTPPHRVKSISMATFTQEEIEFLKQNGNDNCGRTWLGLWDPKRAIKQEHRDFMIDKYERKRYYLEPASPLKSLPTNASSSLTSLTAAKNANESLVPLKTPTLTPPATLRLHRHNSGSCNGLNATVSASSSSLGTAAGCLTSQFQQQFTPDDSDFFGPAATVTADPPKILPPTPQKHPNLQRKNGIKMKKPAGGGELVGPTTYGRNQKNGLLNHSAATAFTGSSGDINANKFTPDGDFVADFGSATIISTVASNGGSHYGSASSLRNGGGALVGSAENGVYHNGVTANGGPASNGELENFADFDHNPIFNSAENMKSYFSSNSIDSNSTPTNSVSSSTASVQSLNGSDPFANFYSLTHTMANGGGSANSAGSTAGTPTGGPLPPKHHHHGGYTCMSSPDEKSAKVTSYGFGNTFPGETRFAASGYGTGYSHLQNYASVVVAHPQPESNRTMGSAANGSFHHNNNNNNDNTTLDNVQWNFWQQFGSNYWPPGAGRGGGDASFQQPQQQQQQQQQQQYRNSNSALQMMSPQRAAGQINYCSDPNRWSLPVSAGLNGSHVNGGSNGNNMHTTTPSIDRYAALKDLDEQFREIKLEAESNNNGPLTALKASAGTSASDPHSHGPANPFKTANPFQQSPAAWPIAAPTNGSPVIGDPRHQPTNGTNGGFYATSPYQGGFVQPGSASHLYNGNVSASTGVTPVAGYHHPAAYHQNGNGYAMVGTNGAMMVNGSGGPQLLNNVPVHHFGNFGNPFMAAGTTAGHSNNPFL